MSTSEAEPRSEPPERQSSEAAGHAPLHVRLPVFEGPLDLLLHLIRKQQIDIKDIPIVLVTEQYIEYLGLMKELNLDLAGEYLVMAATLIHIKSKMLLPVEPAGEDGEAEDPRAELVRQLLEYEKFKRAADELYERDRVERATYPRGGPSEFETETDTLYEASLFDLVAAFKDLLEGRQRREPITLDVYRISVSERVALIVSELDATPMLGFRELFRADAAREEWIVTFLALLELTRLRVVRLLQRGTYGEIVIVRRDPADALETGAGSVGQGASPLPPGGDGA